MKTIEEDEILLESPVYTKHVVIVMDGLKEFTIEPLLWALENISQGSCKVTLLGVMPWLNIPLSTKTWSDIWTLEMEDLSILKERSEWKSDIKYLKLQAIVDLCTKYGVVPQIKVAMGYPLRLLVVEKITSLHASWVVLDRHHRKHKKFYAGKIPCNMVVLNPNGEVDLIKGKSMINSEQNSPGESPASQVPTPKVVIAEGLKVKLKERAQ
ncbi:hypothetical protein L1049_023049 [Liquidambar formosana]|uniref:Uncharacterized protein n=1 Tax=Liquidambar formosana TaxID=63359 RepID=A0AAP0REX1_LIQFO